MPIDDTPTPSAPADRLQFNLKFLLAAVLVFSVLLAVFVPAFRASRGSAPRAACSTLSKIIGVGFHGYHDVYGRFLAPFVPDANGRPMHSWRYPALAFMESGTGTLYDYNQPWNATANLTLSNRIRPPYYYCPTARRHAKDGGVHKVMVVGTETAAPGFPGRSKDDFTDGLANTTFVAEIADSDIHWTEPRDLEFDQMSFQINDRAAQSISSHHPGGAVVMMADGSVRFLADDTAPGVVRGLLTTTGGEDAAP